MREELSIKELHKLSNFIHDTLGIHIDERKKTLLETRLRKRLIHLSINNVGDYIKLLLSNKGQKEELEHFINSITTNKTDFFRENNHFEFLQNIGIPNLLRSKSSLRAWSAACSRGMEPYSLAMVLEEYKRTHPATVFNWSILATDIDTKVLQFAKNAVYNKTEITPIPERLKKKYLLKNRDPNKDEFRVTSQLREKIFFQQLNLMSNFKFRKPIDILFCRNVIIYFSRQTQHKLIMRLLSNLSSDGYLIMGHSEVLDTREFPLKSIAPAIYQRR